MLEVDKVLQGRYRILAQIGRGGMGTVFLARDQNLGLSVAIKQNFFEEDRLIEAFKREARLLAGLRHSALPQVKDYFIEDSGQYLVMEHITGDDLGTVLEKRKQKIPPAGAAKPFEVEQVVHWAEQLLDTLDYLHTRSEPVIHRDIKPVNLKLAERNQIILLDFGLAKGKPLWMTRVTSTGSLYGYTPNYAPIEQIRGLGTDPRSDLYALGATLYHLITGMPPIDAATRAESFLGGEPDPLLPACEVNPKVPRDIAEVLMKAMRPHRNHRPSSAAELLDMLRSSKHSTVVDWKARQDAATRTQDEQQSSAAETNSATPVWPTTEIAVEMHAEEKQQRVEEALRQEKEEEERNARQEVERIAKEQAEKWRHEEEERKAREQVERLEQEDAARKAAAKAESKQREENEREAREAEQRQRNEEQERQNEAERLRKIRERQEELTKQENAQRLREQEERDRVAREEAERRRQAEEENKANQEAERLRLKGEQEQNARNEAAQKQREEESRRAQEEAERLRLSAEAGGEPQLSQAHWSARCERLPRS